MKIKTSFVTNSSGSSTSRIKIENQVLCDIIKKYSEQLYNYYDVKFDKIDLVNGDSLVDYGSYGDGEYKTEFWNFDAKEIDKIPNAYLKYIKESINYKNDSVVNEIFNELEKELNERMSEINNSYTLIDSESDYSGDGGCDNSRILYNKNNLCPNCNGVMIYEFYQGSPDFEKYDIREEFYCPNCSYEQILNDTKKKNVYDDFSDDDESELPF